MKQSSSSEASATMRVDYTSAQITGRDLLERTTRIGDLQAVFADEEARLELPPETPVYRVQAHIPAGEAVAGALSFGNTVIEPGRVGDEYYMTRGHFHAKRDRGEYYLGVSGVGALILMDEGRRTCWERMEPGTVHYVPGHTAHRVANIGSEPVSFIAFWSSDAGHDYATIASQGFSARMREVEGEPTLVPA